jgi:hypothetical protein
MIEGCTIRLRGAMADKSARQPGDYESAAPTKEQGRDAHATTEKKAGASNMPFYQTNPPFSDEFFDGSTYGQIG